MTLVDRPPRTAQLPLPAPPRAGRDYQAESQVVCATLAALAFGVGLWPVLLAWAGPGAVWSLPTLAHVTGMLAGYVVLLLMVLMSRWPVLERGVGSDRLARWHARGGRTVLTLVLVHAWAATQAWAQARGTGIAAALWDVLGMPWLVSATLATALFVTIAVMSVRAARRRLRYETWHAVHLLMYVAIALSFLHQLAGPDMAGYRPIQIGWALMYAHAFGLVLRYRVLGPFRQAARHRLRVDRVVQEAPGVVSIVLSGRHLEELSAEAGQFFRWRFLTPDTWLTAHPFSLSAPPRTDRLRLTVKALGDGSRILQAIEVGTWVVAEGPYGAMTAARRTHRHVLLVAGGVGITPMRALFETMPRDPGQDILLLYRARRPEDLVFRHELDAIARHRGVRVVYVLGDRPGLLAPASFAHLVPDVAQRDVFLCSPPGMADTVRASLAELGLRRRQLHEERFAF